MYNAHSYSFYIGCLLLSNLWLYSVLSQENRYFDVFLVGYMDMQFSKLCVIIIAACCMRDIWGKGTILLDMYNVHTY